MDEKVILSDLITESKDHLLEIEPVLLELEREKNNISLEKINLIFRAIHSIKGGFGFFGFQNITKLSHSMEHLLSLIRDRKLPVTNDLIDAIFRGIDKLKIIFDDFNNNDSIDIKSELDALEHFHDEGAALSGDSSTVEPDSLSKIMRLHQSLPVNVINDEVKDGKSIYRILLDSKKDLDNSNLSFSALFAKWERFGKIIDMSLDLDQIKGLHGSTDQSLFYSVIYASVLETDLIMMGLNVAASQIKTIDPAILKSDNLSDEQNKTKNADVVSNVTPGTDFRAGDDSLRVKLSVLNNLMNLAGELVLSRNQLIQQFNRKIIDVIDIDKISGEFLYALGLSMNTVKNHALRNPAAVDQLISNEISNLKHKFAGSFSIQLKELQGATSTLQSIDAVTSQLQENIMQTRLQPVSVVFAKFPRIIRTLSQKLGKKISLNLVGQEVELDKSIIEMLSDPLTHLIRNSADHGIEKPDVREKAGKDPTGSIFLSASQEGGKVIIKIEDDGQGLDIAKIRSVAIARHIISEQMANVMSVKEIQLLIMEAGFSTASEISDVSGRGVGMDVVRSNVEHLGGTIDIESEPGHGTTISLTLPLTLAIIPSLIISSENQIFAIPQVGVEELVRIRSFEVTNKIERIQNAEVTRLRGKLLPLIRLCELLDLGPTFIHPATKEVLPDKRKRYSDRRGVPDNKNDNTVIDNNSNRRSENGNRRTSILNAVKIVVLKSGFNRFGLIVDSVYDNEEIVVKPLPEYFKATQVYAGATILGDGKVAMILDPVGISIRAGLRFSDLDKEQADEHEKFLKKESEKTEEILFFDNGSKERFGLRLSSVARIEKGLHSEIEHVGRREYMKRDECSFALVRLHDYIPVSPPSEQKSEFFIILPKLTSERKIGIIAESVYDVVTVSLNLDKNNIHGSGIMGSTIINNRLTIIIDMQSLLESINDNLGKQ